MSRHLTSHKHEASDVAHFHITAKAIECTRARARVKDSRVGVRASTTTPYELCARDAVCVECASSSGSQTD